MWYGVLGSGSTHTIVTVSRGSTISEATVCGLRDSTTYTIEVAAVNSGDTGQYSNSIRAETEGKATNMLGASSLLVGLTCRSGNNEFM